jgi:hypothetical protein
MANATDKDIKRIEDILKEILALLKVADYTAILNQAVALLERPEEKTDLSKIETSLESLKSITKTEDIAIIADWLKVISEKPYPEFPDFPRDKNGVPYFTPTKVGGGGGGGLTSAESIALQSGATETTLQAVLAASGGGAYETRIDEVSATVSYIGKATPGSATSAASWQITKLDETTGLVLSYADDVTTFTKVWDNRATYTY